MDKEKTVREPWYRKESRQINEKLERIAEVLERLLRQTEMMP